METIEIEFVPIAPEMLSDALILDAFSPEKGRELKAQVLAKLGLELGDEKPLDVWHRHLSKLNGLEFTQPIHPALATAILESTEARRMEWFLA
jgi:hypothetical protein